jgi:hypothetical protein
MATGIQQGGDLALEILIKKYPDLESTPRPLRTLEDMRPARANRYYLERSRGCQALPAMSCFDDRFIDWFD